MLKTQKARLCLFLSVVILLILGFCTVVTILGDPTVWVVPITIAAVAFLIWAVNAVCNWIERGE